MTQYADTMQKFTALEDDEMNDAEAAYYIEVNARISAKLATVSVNMSAD